MSIGDVILALIVVAVVFFAVRSVFVKKSVGCGGDCAHCGGSCHHTAPPDKKSKHLSKPFGTPVPDGFCVKIVLSDKDSQAELLRCARTAQAVCRTHGRGQKG